MVPPNAVVDAYCTRVNMLKNLQEGQSETSLGERRRRLNDQSLLLLSSLFFIFSGGKRALIQRGLPSKRKWTILTSFMLEEEAEECSPTARGVLVVPAPIWNSPRRGGTPLPPTLPASWYHYEPPFKFPLSIHGGPSKIGRIERIERIEEHDCGEEIRNGHVWVFRDHPGAT